MLLCIKISTINAYTDATTAASFAVNIPEKIPPKINTGSIKDQNPSLRAAKTSFPEGLSISLKFFFLAT